MRNSTNLWVQFSVSVEQSDDGMGAAAQVHRTRSRVKSAYTKAESRLLRCDLRRYSYGTPN